MNNRDRATVKMLAMWVFECSNKFFGPNIDRDDLAQLTLEKILKTKSTPRSLSKSWVYRTAVNTKNDMLRASYRDNLWLDRTVSLDSIRLGQVPEGAIYALSDGNTEPDFFLEAALNKSIEDLSCKRKQAFVLYAEGFSYKEIATGTKTDINTVKTRIYYASVVIVVLELSQR